MKISDISGPNNDSEQANSGQTDQPIFDPQTGKFMPSFVYDPAGKSSKSTWTVKKKIFTVSSLLVLGLIIFVGVKIYASTSKVIARNTGIAAESLKGELKLADLKGEGEGRVNILLLGIGDSGHAGAELTDSIMVVSLDPKTRDVAMLSLPRDMYVKIPAQGYDRVNAAHALGEQLKKGGGPELAKKTISQTLDIPIHYFVRVDFSGLKKAVDAVGGVEIDVAEALYDPEYPCDKNEGRMCGFKLKAGPTHMDGTVALKYARCRKGNCGNDFGRAARQQQILVALRDKALKASTLANPAKLGAMLDVVGDHLRTDLQLDEIQKLADISQKIDQTIIINKVIDDSETGFLYGTNIGGASVLQPKTGNYKQIQAFVHSIFADNYIKSEAAQIAIENSTYQNGLANQVTELLKSYNYTVISTSNAQLKSTTTTIIDYTNGKKPYTIKYLENRFGVKASKASPPAGGSSANTGVSSESAAQPQIKLVLGSDYLEKNKTEY